MNYLIALELHRDRVAQMEREAELRRLAPKRERRPHLFSLRSSRTRPAERTGSVEARPCH